ncbi:FAD-dependent monooxygenase [Streptomyces sp. SP18CS02]|uniref:FAD-dependent monooxygenase n=1 Tax=Streptomyces sp. SP18CS02 TaxID=3002531 RepID=UPI002E76204A|nr:FAD-dependent monooxygenase [Streptomyces sp. SP18CS02]MEE1751877.1 FAD-dependent monooxygenase [Streptomyces sp. SP18CS02]
MGGTAGTEFDVIVVGAGPTGLLLAGDLAAAGAKVALIERRPRAISNLTRAFAVHARTLELLDARGLADELLKTGSRVSRVRLFGALSLDLSRLRSRFPFLLITPQYEVERLLERRALESGVEFRHGTELRGLSQDGDSVTADLAPTAGDGSGTGSATGADTGADTGGGAGGGAAPGATTLRARFLVGADGVRSAVRRSVGLPFPGSSVISSIVLADVRLAEEPDDLFTVAGSGDSFAFVAPFGDGWYRAMGWNRRRQVPDSEPVVLDELREIVRTVHGTDFGMHDVRWISRFHSDERQVPAYRSGRVFLAGDAAHVHSPAGGQGMNTGLQDAANLSWKLGSVLRGEAAEPEALLDSYHSERHPVGKTVLRSSGAIIRLAMAHTPLQRAARATAARLLNTVRPASAKALGMVSGLGIAYGSARGAHRLVGRRAPDLALAEGRLHAVLRKGDFVLITPSGATGEVPAAKGGSASIPPVPGRVTRATWANSSRRTALLVRPDGYIAWAEG